MGKTRRKELLVQVGITGKEEPDSFQRCAVKISTLQKKSSSSSSSRVRGASTQRGGEDVQV